jgi:L,D-transpeptidase catalytic domain
MGWAVGALVAFAAAAAIVGALGGAFDGGPATPKAAKTKVVGPVASPSTTAQTKAPGPVTPPSTIPARQSHRPRTNGRSSGSTAPGTKSTSSPAASSSVASPAAANGCRDTMIATVRRNYVPARRWPSQAGAIVHTFNRTSPLGAPQVFVVDRVRSHAGHRWFHVQLPIRPNGSKGWVRADGVSVSKTDYGLTLDRRTFTLTLYVGCKPEGRFPVGIGTGSTPTPVGRFYLASLLQLPTSNSVYGPYAYGLSGFSDVLTTWSFGGIIGLHGTNDPSSIGRQSSHGCIRLYNRDILRLVRILPLGTPILIV